MLPVIVKILYYNLHEIELSMKIILQNDMKKKKKIKREKDLNAEKKICRKRLRKK